MRTSQEILTEIFASPLIPREERAVDEIVPSAVEDVRATEEKYFVPREEAKRVFPEVGKVALSALDFLYELGCATIEKIPAAVAAMGSLMRGEAREAGEILTQRGRGAQAFRAAFDPVFRPVVQGFDQVMGASLDSVLRDLQGKHHTPIHNLLASVLQGEVDLIRQHPSEIIPSIVLWAPGRALQTVRAVPQVLVKGEEVIGKAVKAAPEAARKVRGEVVRLLKEEMGTAYIPLPRWKKKDREVIPVLPKPAPPFMSPEYLEQMRAIWSRRVPDPPVSGALEASEGLVVKQKVREVIARQDQLSADLPKYVGAINLERINVPDDVKKMQVAIAQEFPERIEEARRGTITWEQTARLAEELGMTPHKLLKRKPGYAGNAEQIWAARQIHAHAAKELESTLRQLRPAILGGEERALAEASLAMLKYKGIFAQTQGLAAEAGRALAIHRRIAGEPVGVHAELVAKFMTPREIRNTEKLADLLARIDPDDVDAVRRLAQEAQKPRFGDYAHEIWINGLLSSPVTHARNLLSNTLTYLSAVPERFGAATLDYFRATVGGKPREVFFREIPAFLFGFLDGVKNSIRRGAYSFRYEIPFEAGLTKIEVARHGAIPGRVGRMIRFPGTAMMVADEFFKGLNASSEIRALAMRQALKEGKRGKDLTARIVEILESPPRAILDAVDDVMHMRTFTSHLGKTGRALLRMRDEVPGLRYLLPFLRTPINILKFGYKWTPLNFIRIFMKEKNIWGMSKYVDSAEMLHDLSRATMGTLMQLGLFQLVREGYLTGGGPVDSAKRRMLEAEGWQPYSIRIGETYYFFGGIEPVATIFGTVADFAEVFDEMDEASVEEVIQHIGASVTENLAHKTFMSGLVDALAAIQDPERFGERWMRRFASSWVPNVFASVARGRDENLRAARGIVDSFKARIPRVRKTLPVVRDLWGEIVRYEGPFIERIISPVYRRMRRDDPVVRELLRLKIHIARPARKIGDAELTPEQYDRYSMLLGQALRESLSRFMARPLYKKMTDEARVRHIESLRRKVSKAVRSRLLREISTTGTVATNIEAPLPRAVRDPERAKEELGRLVVPRERRVAEDILAEIMR